MQLISLISEVPVNDAQDFLARKSRDLCFLADTCITHARPHQLNLILSLAALHQTSSSTSAFASIEPPLLHRAALLPVFNPSVLCTVLAHDDNVNVADAAGAWPGTEAAQPCTRLDRLQAHHAPLALPHTLPSASFTLRLHRSGARVRSWTRESSRVPHGRAEGRPVPLQRPGRDSSACGVCQWSRGSRGYLGGKSSANA